MRKQLSMWSSYFVELDPYEMVLELEKNGYTASELSDEHGFMLMADDEVKAGKEFKAFAAQHGVTFPQGHLWLKIALCDGKDDTIPKLKKWINLFEAIGIERMVLHCDDMGIPTEDNRVSKKVLDANVAALRQLIPFLQGKKIYICLENLRTAFVYAEDLLYIIEQLNDGHFAVCLDTGHLNLTVKNHRDFIRKCGSKLKALHIADNEGYTDQHIMPYGRGTVDFAEVMKGLDEIGYDGVMNYEIPGERSCPLAVRAMKLKYIKETFKYMTENYDK